MDDERIDPRFLLANERTFLAWSRTALALVAAGLAATELLDGASGAWHLVGVPLIVAGGAVAWLAHRRRGEAERALLRGDDLPPTSLPALLTVVVVLTAAAAVVLSLVR